MRRFDIPFSCQSPEIDESAQNDESPLDLVKRLAYQKAQIISRKNPQAIVVGSDQLAVFEGRVIGKPGNFDSAQRQLAAFSGRVVEFLTAVSVQRCQNVFAEIHVDITRVSFRTLRHEEIVRYLEKEKPFDCVGAFKAESMGIVLFDKILSEDPTALIGLPLIRTAEILRRAGLQLP